MDPIDHLFRRESGRMIAVMTRVFGIDNIALAEDSVQDAFCRAVEIWRYRGIPENPAAWLMAAAKNRAIDLLRRERIAQNYAGTLAEDMKPGQAVDEPFEAALNTGRIADDQLRLMFSCCQSRLAEDAQVALILCLLCGFSVDETAAAFLASHSATEKRITRAKKVLKESHHLFELSDTDFSARLSAVQRALYLLFNEGYHGASSQTPVRADLCHEAIRLAGLLAEHPFSANPATHALAALMCLDAARLPARVDGNGCLTTLFDQDRSKWDVALIREGMRLLDLSAEGSDLTIYHIEAAIAGIHSCAPSLEETDWEAIISLYDTLLKISSSPVVALNRAIAIAQHEGPARGLEEIRSITASERLAAYPFYSAAIGELELRAGRSGEARRHFGQAVSHARNPMERQFLEKRLRSCDDASG